MIQRNGNERSKPHNGGESFTDERIASMLEERGVVARGETPTREWARISLIKSK